MKIPDGVLLLIEEEQLRQEGRFYPSGSDYLNKLSKHAELLVHQFQDKILGFVFFYCNAQDKKNSYITLIATSDSSRGMGVAASLVSHVLNLARHRGFSECSLEVRKDNLPALRLYEKMGFSFKEDRCEKILMNVELG